MSITETEDRIQSLWHSEIFLSRFTSIPLVEFITLAILYCVSLAKLELHFLPCVVLGKGCPEEKFAWDLEGQSDTQPCAWGVGALDISAGCTHCCDLLVLLVGMGNSQCTQISSSNFSKYQARHMGRALWRRTSVFLQVACIIRVDMVRDRCGFHVLLMDSSLPQQGPLSLLPRLCVQLFLPPALLTCRDFRLQPDAETTGFTDSTSFSLRPWLVTFSFASNRPLPDLCLLSSSHNYAMSNPCRKFLISYHSQQFCFSGRIAHTVFSSRPFNT